MSAFDLEQLSAACCPASFQHFIRQDVGIYFGDACKIAKFLPHDVYLTIVVDRRVEQLGHYLLRMNVEYGIGSSR